MEIKPAGRIPYTEKVWNEYKSRLAHELRTNALDSDQIFKDATAKQLIVSYMEQELVNEKKEAERLILGLNIRLAHMELETSEGNRTFPIVNEYKGHHLMKTYYFYKDNNECKIGCVEVNPTSLII